MSGPRVKIRYIAQPKVRPPFFVLFGNAVESIPESYKRYLVNVLRETFGLFGVPIRLSMRSSGLSLTAPDRRGSAYGQRPCRARASPCRS